ncbi:von Willebrand factor-like [Liolophura sinensis]|uniref:von Willebrand factor-like n=1 Tax=Liolophura sinensis TaxID=3198878 RepID=UPI0031587D17
MIVLCEILVGTGQIQTLDNATCACRCKGLKCKVNQFRCHNGQCLDENLLCDGAIDCDSDELNCTTMTPPTSTISATRTTPLSSTISVSVTMPPTTPTTTNVCDKTMCPPLSEPPKKLGEQHILVKTSDGCCDIYKVVCNCSGLTCQYPMKPKNVSTKECCPRCSCPSVCPPPTDITCRSGSTRVTVISVCNCKSYACVDNTTAPTTSAATTISVGTTPHVTPPPPCSRTLPNGTSHTYQPGQKWNETLCRSCKCEDDMKSSGGVTCMEKQCEKCKLGEKEVKIPGQCCPVCLPYACVVDGKVYTAGKVIPSASPEDKCLTTTCEHRPSDRAYYIRKSWVSCPVDLPFCKEGQRDRDITGCCPLCLNSTESTCATCDVKLVYGIPSKSIGFFKVQDNGVVCKNTEIIPDLSECSGYCGSSAKYKDLLSGLQNDCRCCQAQTTVSRPLKLKCDNGTIIERSYKVPTSCGCSVCTGSP